MMEDALWEGLALGGTSEGTGETERLGDWQVSFDLSLIKIVTKLRGVPVICSESST